MRYYSIRYTSEGMLILKEVDKDTFKASRENESWRQGIGTMITQASIKIENGVLELFGHFHGQTHYGQDFGDWSEIPIPYESKMTEEVFHKDTDIITFVYKTGIWPFRKKDPKRCIKLGWYRNKAYDKKTIRTSHFRIIEPKFPVQPI